MRKLAGQRDVGLMGGVSVDAVAGPKSRNGGIPRRETSVCEVRLKFVHIWDGHRYILYALRQHPSSPSSVDPTSSSVRQ